MPGLQLTMKDNPSTHPRLSTTPESNSEAASIRVGSEVVAVRTGGGSSHILLRRVTVGCPPPDLLVTTGLTICTNL